MSGFVAGIPMDTTEQAEECFLLLPMLKSIGFSKIILFSVFDQNQRRPVRKDDRYAGATWGQSFFERYLVDQAQQVRAMGFEVETKVLTGKAGETAVRAIAEGSLDLVVIATHGRTGIARLRLGSVAETIIKNSPCPRLVIGPNVEIDLEHYALKRILVPLDGSPLAELALPIARYLAGLTQAELDLLRVVPTSTAPVDTMVSAMDVLTITLDEADAYIGSVADGIPGLKVNTTVINGEAGHGIITYLKDNPVDLVVIASRGRTGIGRMAMGSVAERILHGPDPVLVFEADEDKGAFFAAARAAV